MEFSNFKGKTNKQKLNVSAYIYKLFQFDYPTTPYNVALGYEEEIIVAKLAGFALTTHYLGTCFRFLVQNMQKK